MLLGPAGGPVLLTAHRGTVTSGHTSLPSRSPVNLKNGEIVVLLVEQNVLECGVPRAMPPRTAATGNTPAREHFCNHKSVTPPTNPGLPQVAWAVAFLGSRRTGSDGEHSLITTRNSSGLLSSSVPPAGRANSGLWAVSTRCPVAPRGVCRHTCHHPSLTRGGSLPVPES